LLKSSIIPIPENILKHRAEYRPTFQEAWEELGAKEFSIDRITPQGRASTKVSLEEITSEEREGKELLGKADGQDLTHCAYLGVKYCKGFSERAKWYYVSHQSNPFSKILRLIRPSSIHVEFYGEKR